LLNLDKNFDNLKKIKLVATNVGRVSTFGHIYQKMYKKKIQMWNLVGLGLKVFLANLSLSSRDICTFYLCRKACIMGVEKGDAHST